MEDPYLRRGDIVTLTREGASPGFFDKIPDDIKGIIFWVDWVDSRDEPGMKYQEAKIIWNGNTGLSVHWSAKNIVVLKEGHDDRKIIEKKLMKFLCRKYKENK